MISALRTHPDGFDMKRGWLRHIPSGHMFDFDEKGRVSISARCDCAFLSVSEAQGRELHSAFQDWHVAYWRPLEINREFASHFRRPKSWAGAFRIFMARLGRRLSWPVSAARPSEAGRVLRGVGD
jgi:hypothetical protein